MCQVDEHIFGIRFSVLKTFLGCCDLACPFIFVGIIYVLLGIAIILFSLIFAILGAIASGNVTVNGQTVDVDVPGGVKALIHILAFLFFALGIFFITTGICFCCALNNKGVCKFCVNIMKINFIIGFLLFILSIIAIATSSKYVKAKVTVIFIIESIISEIWSFYLLWVVNSYFMRHFSEGQLYAQEG